MKYVLRIALAAAMVGSGACRLKHHPPDGSGTIECTQVRLAPQVGGRIVELPLQEGAVLRPGDLVVRIDPADYVLRRDEAAAALAQTQAQLDLVKAGSRPEDVQRAQAQVREARAAAEAAAADLQRIQQVFERNSATQKQLDDAKSARDRTAAALAGAEQNLRRIENGSREEEVRLAAAAVDLAKVRLAQAEKAVADCTLVAETGGTVIIRHHERGEWIAPGSPVLTVAQLDNVWLSVYVPERHLPTVRVGQEAQVCVDGLTRAFTGTVSFVSPEAEFTPRNVQTQDERAKLVYRVKIALQNPDGLFKPGMPADAYLVGRQTDE